MCGGGATCQSNLGDTLTTFANHNAPNRTQSMKCLLNLTGRWSSSYPLPPNQKTCSSVSSPLALVLHIWAFLQVYEEAFLVSSPRVSWVQALIHGRHLMTVSSPDLRGDVHLLLHSVAPLEMLALLDYLWKASVVLCSTSGRSRCPSSWTRHSLWEGALA